MSLEDALPDPLPRDRRRVLLDALPLLVAAAVVVVYGLAEKQLGHDEPLFPLDDSYIHLQFARQLAAGHGLVYNFGEASNGSTAPLFTLLLALGFSLPGIAPLLWAKLLGIIAFFACVFLSARLGTALGLSPVFSRCAGLIVALTPWFAWSALSGMEILPFTALTLLGTLCHLRAGSALSLPILALAALFRPEGLLLLLLAVVERLAHGFRSPDGIFRLERRLLLEAMAAALVLVPTSLTFFFRAGSFLPTTFTAKTVRDDSLLPSGRYLRTAFEVLFDLQPLFLLFAAAGALVVLGRKRWILPALWPFALPIAYSFLASDFAPAPVGNFGRYLFPLAPFLVVLGLLGLQQGLTPFAAGLRLPFPLNRAVAVSGPILGLLLLIQLLQTVSGPGRYGQTLANVATSDVRAAHWLREQLPQEAVLGAQDIGALKFYMPDNRLVDLAGIIDPAVLPFLRTPGTGYWEERVVEFLGNTRPDYILAFNRSFPALTSGQFPGFSRARTFVVENNVTMAGNELVLLSTPWTRFPLKSTG
jgi:hypothetical protein